MGISFLKKGLVIIFLLGLIHLASADLFIVSIEQWINCKDYEDNITICQKNPEYSLMERNIIPNINTNYYDQVMEEVVGAKNQKIENLETRITGYATYNTEIEDLYSAMEKVYWIGLVLLSALLVNANYQMHKLKRKK